MNTSRKLVTFWLVLYIAGCAVIAWWLVRVREHQLQSPAPEMQASWERWKADVQSDAERKMGPVARRVPTASEPPATILVRDHFPAILTTVYLVWTAMFGFLAMAVTGVLRGAPPPHRDEAPRPGAG